MPATSVFRGRGQLIAPPHAGMYKMMSGEKQRNSMHRNDMKIK